MRAVSALCWPFVMTIRPARKGESRLLSELALRSKAVWGYSPEFMRACEEELTLDEEEMDQAFVKTTGDRVVGFYSLQPLSGTRVELGYLFVEPSLLRKGHGRELISDACACARAAGYRCLVIQGDPHAVDFYRAASALQVGERESDSVPGRMLPLFEIAL